MKDGDTGIAGKAAGGDGTALSLKRRAILLGLAALPGAAVSAGSTKSEDLAFPDQVILYLRDAIEAAGCDLSQSDGARQVAIFERMTALAAAMVAIPGISNQASSAKRQVAEWHAETNLSQLRLPFQIRCALMASAKNDG